MNKISYTFFLHLQKVILFTIKSIGEIKKIPEHYNLDNVTLIESIVLVLRKMVLWYFVMLLPTFYLPVQSDVSISLLVSRKDLLACICGIYSFFYTSKLLLSLYIFDDGSLSQTDKIVLRLVFQNLYIIDSLEADRKVIKSYISVAPNALLVRKRVIYLRKKIDMPLIIKSNKFIQIDSDILFFSIPKELIAWTTNENDLRTLFMHDCLDHQILSNIEHRTLFSADLIRNFNSGLVAIAKNYMKIKTTEKFCTFLLSENSILIRPLSIQSIYSSFLANKEKSLIMRLPSTYYVGFEEQTNKNLICRHYVRRVRKYFYRDAIPLVFSFIRNKSWQN